MIHNLEWVKITRIWIKTYWNPANLQLTFHSYFLVSWTNNKAGHGYGLITIMLCHASELTSLRLILILLSLLVLSMHYTSPPPPPPRWVAYRGIVYVYLYLYFAWQYALLCYRATGAIAPHCGFSGVPPDRNCAHVHWGSFTSNSSSVWRAIWFTWYACPSVYSIWCVSGGHPSNYGPRPALLYFSDRAYELTP